MKSLELRVPPVAVVLVFAGMMRLGATAVPSLAFDLPGRRVLAAMCAGLGVAITLAGLVAFHRAETTVNPINPEAARTMVTSGVYRVSRNPMYLGFLLCLTGWAVFLAHLPAFALLPLFVAYMNRFQIVPEERALAAKFGERFVSYRRAVRRWL